jgi:hypothetical protein
MAPGFALILFIVMAAALAPVFEAAGIGLLFFNRTRGYAKIILTVGMLDFGVVLAAFLLFGLFHGRLPNQENLIVSAASFSIAAAIGAMYRFVKERRNSHRVGS